MTQTCVLSDFLLLLDTTVKSPLIQIYSYWFSMLSFRFFFFKGLTDDMRKDYRMMRDLSTHTRMDPDRRQHKLLTFMDALRK